MTKNIEMTPDQRLKAIALWARREFEENELDELGLTILFGVLLGAVEVVTDDVTVTPQQIAGAGAAVSVGIALAKNNGLL